MNFLNAFLLGFALNPSHSAVFAMCFLFSSFCLVSFWLFTGIRPDDHPDQVWGLIRFLALQICRSLRQWFIWILNCKFKLSFFLNESMHLPNHDTDWGNWKIHDTFHDAFSFFRRLCNSRIRLNFLSFQIFSLSTSTILLDQVLLTALSVYLSKSILITDGSWR